jgi:hypothetical protein
VSTLSWALLSTAFHPSVPVLPAGSFPANEAKSSNVVVRGGSGKRPVFAYALQVEPDRFKGRDTTTCEKSEKRGFSRFQWFANGIARDALINQPACQER